MAGRFSVEAVFKAIDQVSMPISRIQSRMRRFTRNTTRNFKSLNRAVDNTIKKITRLGRQTLVATTAGLGAVTIAVKGVLTEFAKFENATTSFIPILGSLENAEQLMKGIADTAVTTPFQIDDLAQAATALLNMGAATQDTVVPAIRMLGDLSGGSADKLSRLAINYGEIVANNKAMTRDLRQFTTAGVPIMAELANILGVNIDQIQEMASKGKITADVVTKALKNMTGEGGKFFRAMDLASQTNSGLWSNLKENISLTAVAIGQEISPTVKLITNDLINLTGRLQEWVKLHGKDIREAITGAYQWFKDNWRDILDGFKTFFKWSKILLTAYIGLKAATIAWNTWLLITKASQFAYAVAIGVTEVATGRLITVTNLSKLSLIGHSIGTKAATAAMWLFNKGTKALIIGLRVLRVVMATAFGPIGLVITLLSVGALLLIQHWDKVKEFFTNLWDSMPDIFKNAIRLVFLPLRMLIGAVKLIIDNWGAISGFFKGIWDAVVNSTSHAIEFVVEKIKWAKDKVNEFLNWLAEINPLKETGEFLGEMAFNAFGPEVPDLTAPTPVVVSPQERMSKTIQENNTRSEFVLRDDTGRVEPVSGKVPDNVKVIKTGGF